MILLFMAEKHISYMSSYLFFAQFYEKIYHLQILQKERMIDESYLHSIWKMTKFDFLFFSNLNESS